MKEQNHPDQVEENKMGGIGPIYTKHFVTGESCGAHIRILAQVTLPVGSSLGVHTHSGEREVYHILSGKALYQDDEQTYEIAAGDTTVCLDGHSHGISNIGEEDLVWVAAVIRD